jgi:hypothetical protein
MAKKKSKSGKKKGGGALDFPFGYNAPGAKRPRRKPKGGGS